VTIIIDGTARVYRSKAPTHHPGDAAIYSGGDEVSFPERSPIQ
jgi:hypothetical protein